MWPNSQETTDLVTFTEEIYNGKLHFLCSDVEFTIKTFNNKYFPVTKSKIILHKNRK